MRTAPALLIAAATLLALTSCVKDDGPVIPQPVPSSTPIFASDEEALAAAEEAYAAYLAASNAVTATGAVDAEPLKSLTTPNMYAKLVDSLAEYTKSGLHTSGSSTFDSFELEQYSGGTKHETITAYVCIDVTGLSVLDELNRDVTPAGRDSRVPLEVAFDASSSDTLLLDRSDLWTGDDFCE